MQHLIILAVSAVLAAQPARSAVFGGNEFIPVTTASPQARAIAVSLLKNSWEEVDEKTLRLAPEKLDQLLCPREPLSRDPSLSYACTGFLVAPDLLVTAGHCAGHPGETRDETGLYCEAFSWLFDYRADENGKFASPRVPAENHYRCKRIIYAVREEKAPFRDFALIQLERPVLDREPLRLNALPLPAQETLSMLGHPLGTPLKRSAGGKILLDKPERQILIASLTALEGNSGSPVFNERDEVVGILIGGTPSMGRLTEGKAQNKCEVLNRCDAQALSCGALDKDTSVFPGFQRFGSEVQRIAPVLELLRNEARRGQESKTSLQINAFERSPFRAPSELRERLRADARRGHRPVGYGEARRQLFGKMALKNTPEGFAIRDIYCDRDYTARDFPAGQGPGPGKVPKAEIMNAEHTWPQSRFGGQEKDAQKCDLHHLFPSDSQMNAIRGNHPFGEVVSDVKATKCPVSRFGRSAEGRWVFAPPVKQRGDTARALFYFSVRYELAIGAEEETTLRRWHREDPVSAEERARNSEVEKIQGNRNPFVDQPAFVEQIADF